MITRCSYCKYSIPVDQKLLRTMKIWWGFGARIVSVSTYLIVNQPIQEAWPEARLFHMILWYRFEHIEGNLVFLHDKLLMLFFQIAWPEYFAILLHDIRYEFQTYSRSTITCEVNWVFRLDFQATTMFLSRRLIRCSCYLSHKKNILLISFMDNLCSGNAFYTVTKQEKMVIVGTIHILWLEEQWELSTKAASCSQRQMRNPSFIYKPYLHVLAKPWKSLHTSAIQPCKWILRWVIIPDRIPRTLVQILTWCKDQPQRFRRSFDQETTW